MANGTITNITTGKQYRKISYTLDGVRKHTLHVFTTLGKTRQRLVPITRNGCWYLALPQINSATVVNYSYVFFVKFIKQKAKLFNALKLFPEDVLNYLCCVILSVSKSMLTHSWRRIILLVFQKACSK